MKDFVNSIRFKILLAILAVLFGFMIQAAYAGGTAPLFSQLLSFVTVPIQRVSSSIADSTSAFFDTFLRAGEIAAENEELRSQITELRNRQADYDKIKNENDQFKNILGVKQNRPDLQFEPALVIARDPSDRFYSFTLDRGSKDGVSVLDPVITPQGLVGYVAEVGTNYSKVRTILDVSMNAGAFASRTQDIGIVSGTVELAQEGMCQLEYLPRESKITSGDLILTGGGPLFPKDLVIGQVKDVKINSHGTSLEASVQPSVDIRNVKDVFIITYFEGQGSD